MKKKLDLYRIKSNAAMQMQMAKFCVFIYFVKGQHDRFKILFF